MDKAIRLGFCATNPCHLFALACACAELGETMAYYSGYPKWKLGDVPGNMEVQAFPWRTLVTYGLLGKVPPRFRPSDAWLYRWQDTGFDRAVARKLKGGHSMIHAMPGQCIETFRAAKKLGMKTVLNHPTGPIGMQLDAVRGEYERVGLPLPDESEHATYLLALEADEYALADFHCVASSVVKSQLVGKGVAGETIWTVPYGADPSVWNTGEPQNTPNTRKETDNFKIVFAGQLSLRKGLRFLLEALEGVGEKLWELNVFGRMVDETKKDRDAYKGSIPVNYHGAVDQQALAEAFRQADVLVLPSLEEGFGLVVPQALSCGTPCVVSDCVGAKDLIVDGENGSIFRSGDSRDLAEKLMAWSECRKRVATHVGWSAPAAQLIRYSREALV